MITEKLVRPVWEDVYYRERRSRQDPATVEVTERHQLRYYEPDNPSFAIPSGRRFAIEIPITIAQITVRDEYVAISAIFHHRTDLEQENKIWFKPDGLLRPVYTDTWPGGYNRTGYIANSDDLVVPDWTLSTAISEPSPARVVLPAPTLL
ncbi:MAG: hypothetical protein AAF413_03940 [Patescibacteria group bacterium]